jgi:hypothetical protein
VKTVKSQEGQTSQRWLCTTCLSWERWFQHDLEVKKVCQNFFWLIFGILDSQTFKTPNAKNPKINTRQKSLFPAFKI